MTIMIIFSIFLSSFLILFSYFISHKSNFPIQLGIVNDEGERKSQYECGLELFEEEIGIETRERFYMKFYIIGILFLIFDLETLLLYPIALLFHSDYCNNFHSSPRGVSSIIDNSQLPIKNLEIYTALTVDIDSKFKAFIVFLIFIFILLLGLFYEYRRGSQNLL